jgi:hypothetical protein
MMLRSFALLLRISFAAVAGFEGVEILAEGEAPAPESNQT